MSRPHVPPGQLEKYSSAITLSDMEIFIFPELLYSLVLANILSPRLWAWRDDPWFRDITKLKPYRRVLRLKQFIIDHYEFNLDLDTWGLTTKEQELARFAPFMAEDAIGRSNALFGYEGDQYYFSQDIRRHFGLDKYTTNVIPYWKTETVEAMDAFRLKPGYTRGAGECVSLSTLYAAALFVVCRVPLDEIFLMATPLHSQNYIALGDGVITNNRRIVTKNMWFNGTEQTGKAQRALRHEQITIVAHQTGHIHTIYPEATIDPAAYARFQQHLRGFLRTEITMEILANLLRDASELQKCFQIRQDFHGRPHFIPAERVYAYEHASSFKVSDATREKLLAEIDEDEFFPDLIPGRMLLNKFDDFFKGGGVDIDKPADLARLAAALDCQCNRAGEVIEKLVAFARHEPRFPDHTSPKTFGAGDAIAITPEMTREQVLAHLLARRAKPEADLALYAYRDLALTDWKPFLRSALDRNPVSIAATKDLTEEQVIAQLVGFAATSIYDGTRAAQPDEVWNYRTGDGLEKALCAANILRARKGPDPLSLELDGDTATLRVGPRAHRWPGAKGFTERVEL